MYNLLPEDELAAELGEDLCNDLRRIRGCWESWTGQNGWKTLENSLLAHEYRAVAYDEHTRILLHIIDILTAKL